MHIALSCYTVLRGGLHRIWPVCPGVFEWMVPSRDLGKARQRLVERVRQEARKLDRQLFSRLIVPPGRELERLHLELKVSGDGDKKHVAGWFPVIVDSRPAGEDRVLRIGYHPLRPNDWFPIDESQALSDQVRRAYTRILDPDDDFDSLKIEARDKLFTLRVDVEAPSLLDLLQPKQPEQPLTMGPSANLDALFRVAVNQTARAASGRLPPGVPRDPYRSRLQQLLCGTVQTPVLVVGPPGSGKSTLIARAVHDLLSTDGYPVHNSLDKVRNVLALRGRHIIAGMSYVGQWEARCVGLLERARKRRLVLWSDDVHAWGSLGRTNVSERTLADFFRGPLARRDLIVIGECTPEQLTLLEHEAPQLAACFARVHVEPATEAQTLGMLIHESRRLEPELEIEVDPRSYRSILDLSGSLHRNGAFPGKALGPLGSLARRAAAADAAEAGRKAVTVEQVLELFCQQTGLPRILLTSDPPLERARLERELGQQIVGQKNAIEAASDLVLSIRAQGCAAGRPYGVFLFTGPTGTGKTELAKCLTEYLYGDVRRLVRFDMGEFNTADAPSRLIGDRAEPEGLLTRALRAQPFSLLLLDEIEKAHPLVLNLMLQVFDDGRLADARGNVADFTHAVIVLTSNLGADRRTIKGFVDNPEAVSAEVAQAVREFFPPELFNRIDRVVAFEPLSRHSTHGIAQKELAQLAARPGLSQRSIFLRTTAAAVERIVADGYDAPYGARALKRHIDRGVGDLLARTIAGERSAEMRSLLLYCSEQGLRVHSEGLREAPPFEEQSPIEELIALDARSLLREAPAALDVLRALEEPLAALGAELSRELERFQSGDRRGADRAVNIDALRSHVTHLRRRFESLVASDRELQELDRRRKREEGRELAAEDYTTLDHAAAHARRGRRPRAPRRSSGAPRTDRTLLADLAEVSFMQSLLRSADSVAAHLVSIDLLRLAVHHERRRFSSGSPGLLEWLSQAYAQGRGHLEQAAVTLQDGTVRGASGFEELRILLEHRPRQVALRIGGPGVRDFFALETGCHVRRSSGFGPEIVRVKVGADTGEPEAYLRQHAERLRAFEAGLEGVGKVVDNPEELLPVVRSVQFDPLPEGASTATVEDFRFAYVASRRVHRLEEILKDFWLLSLGSVIDREPSR